MKRLFAIVCMLMAVLALVFAQPNQSEVEVKTDRFSQATVIKLKPQKLLDTPDQLITLELEAKFENKKFIDEFDMTAAVLNEKASVRFESFDNAVTDFGDRELHFIVDGKRISVGESSRGIPDRSDNPNYKTSKSFFNYLKTDQLKQLADGKNVEMRLGKYEFTLNSAVLDNVRGFVREYTNFAPSGRLKRR